MSTDQTCPRFAKVDRISRYLFEAKYRLPIEKEGVTQDLQKQIEYLDMLKSVHFKKTVA
jgi:hypothetical protein